MSRDCCVAFPCDAIVCLQFVIVVFQIILTIFKCFAKLTESTNIIIMGQKSTQTIFSGVSKQGFGCLRFNILRQGKRLVLYHNSSD